MPSAGWAAWEKSVPKTPALGGRCVPWLSGTSPPPWPRSIRRVCLAGIDKEGERAMKLSVLGGGGVRMPTFVRAVLAGRLGAFDEICLFEPDATRRATTARLAAEVGGVLGQPGVVTVTADAAEAFTGADYVFSAIRVGR